MNILLRILSGTILLNLSIAGAGASEIAGSYSGRYQCAQSNTFNTQIKDAGNGQITAVFHFAAPGGSGTFTMTGQFDSGNSRFHLEPERWITRPQSVGMVTLDGSIDPQTGSLSGKVATTGCDDFEGTRQGAPPPRQPGISPTRATPTGSVGRPAIAGSVPPPGSVPPELRSAPSNVIEAWMTSFGYWDVSMSDGKGAIRESEPIDDVFDRLSREKFSCIDTTHVFWDPSGTKGSAAGRVTVTERFAIECDGQCDGVRYTPKVAAAVIHFGKSVPAPLLQIKTPWLGGGPITWEFTRPAGAQPPDIYIHRWTAGTFNTGAAGCKPPKS